MGELRFVAYDEEDLNGSPLGEVTDAFAKHIDVEYNGTGGGDFSISRHSSQAQPWTRPDRYIRVWLDTITGDPEHSFFIVQSADVILGEDEDGVEVYRRQGPGPLFYLSDGIVWQESNLIADSAEPVPNTDIWQWRAPVHPAGILLRMIEENVDRGYYPDLTYDFSRTTDSDGNAWTISVDDFTLEVGLNMLEVVAKLQELGLVLKMDHDFVLHAYESVDNAPTGPDLSASVRLEKGEDIKDSAEREQMSSTTRSTMLVKGARTDNGEIAWRQVDSAAGLSETKRPKAGFWDAGSTTGSAALAAIGFDQIYRKLRLKAGPTAIGTRDPNTDGKRALIDYFPGDQVTVNIPGVFNDVVKPITSIQMTETEAGEYDTVVGFDEDPARLEGPATIQNGPAGVPDTGCCPEEGPFTPPPTDTECGLVAAVTLHIGSHSFFGEPDPPDHNFDYASLQGITASLVSGMQYRQLVTVVFNNPTTGSDSTMSGDPFVYLAYPTGGTPANPPGPSGAIIDSSGWTWSVGGVADNGIDTASNGGFSGGYGTGATFDSGWKTFDGPDVVADIIARGIPVSGFHGFEWVASIRIEVRNGDGSAIVCDEPSAPAIGQKAREQSATSGVDQKTNYPYLPGSLQVWVGGVLVSVVEVDPTTGEFTLPFDPGGHTVIISYQVADPTPTDAGNIAPTGGGGIDTIPDDVLPPAASIVEVPFPHGSMGSTETLDLDDSTWHTGTLNANVAITVTGFTDDEAGTMTVGLTQDGTGGWDVTWDADVDFGGADDQPNQTAGAITWYTLWSVDGDSTIYGAKVGGSSPITYATPAIVLGSAAAAGSADSVIRSDATIVAFDATAPTTQAVGDTAATGSAAVAARRDHKHAITRPALDDLTDVAVGSAAIRQTLIHDGTNFVNSSGIWRPLMDGAGAVITDGGTGEAVMALS